MKIALVYDRVNKWGGAERVLLSLHKIYPKAPLYTSVYDKKNASWADVFDVKVSFLQKIPFIKSHNELFPFLMPRAFESFNFNKYDLVISVTSESAKGVITKGKTIHICLCLTPTRYLWSGYETYFQNKILRLLSKPFVSYLRKWDLRASQRPNHYIAISQEVGRRIKKYYGRDSKVIYPAIEIKRKNLKAKKGEYYLVVSRLSKYVLYKKVDLVIEAFNINGKNLKIVGTGSLEKELKKKARENIEFLGRVEDSELEKLYKGAKALIFPGNEDFGLVMAEAQSFGTPVIAFEGGGALEIIEKGRTGEFFKKQEVKSLLKVLKNFDERRYNKKVIRRSAERFSFKIFKKELLKFTGDLSKK
jgi:glycosyltransferase involved in cell wall biosynthesis